MIESCTVPGSDDDGTETRVGKERPGCEGLEVTPCRLSAVSPDEVAARPIPSVQEKPGPDASVLAGERGNEDAVLREALQRRGPAASAGIFRLVVRPEAGAASCHT